MPINVVLLMAFFLIVVCVVQFIVGGFMPMCISKWKSMAIAVLVVFLSGAISAEVVSTNLTVSPGSVIATSLTCEVIGTSRTDNSSTTVTGNALTELDIEIDNADPTNITIHSIEFVGGRLNYSDMDFTLSYGFFGSINVDTHGIKGFLASPNGPVLVVENDFNSSGHTMTFDQGTIRAEGSGAVGSAFEDTTFDLSQEPMTFPLESTGTVTASLQSFDGMMATYSVTLTMPFDYDSTVYDDESATISMAGSGDVVSVGTFSVPVCPFRADIAGDNCFVDLADLAVFVTQWMAENDCDSPANIAGDDCEVNMEDFNVLASEWMIQLIVE